MQPALPPIIEINISPLLKERDQLVCASDCALMRLIPAVGESSRDGARLSTPWTVLGRAHDKESQARVDASETLEPQAADPQL